MERQLVSRIRGLISDGATGGAVHASRGDKAERELAIVHIEFLSARYGLRHLILSAMLSEGCRTLQELSWAALDRLWSDLDGLAERIEADCDVNPMELMGRRRRS